MKSLLSAFLIAVMIGGFGLAGTLQFDKAQASTDVTGIIYSDTTWTPANSPYSLTGPVGVASGVILTIEPGTKIILNNHPLNVNGTLIAKGTSADPVYFDGTSGGNINFAASSSSWNEETGTGSIIEKTIINSSRVYLSNSPKINDNIIIGDLRSEGDIEVSPVISNNNVKGQISCRGSPLVLNNNVTGIIGCSGSPVISKNIINAPEGFSEAYPGTGVGRVSYQDIGIGVSVDAYLCDNVVVGYFQEAAVSIGGEGRVIVERNLISTHHLGESSGIFIGPSVSPLIQNNSISDCDMGIYCLSSSSTIGYNNI